MIYVNDLLDVLKTLPGERRVRIIVEGHKSEDGSTESNHFVETREDGNGIIEIVFRE
jgi:hypothetical protein